jgi:hypothetical protein
MEDKHEKKHCQFLPVLNKARGDRDGGRSLRRRRPRRLGRVSDRKHTKVQDCVGVAINSRSLISRETPGYTLEGGKR